MATAGAAKSREAHRHRPKQRPHSMKPPVLDMTRLTARRAIRTQDRMVVGLYGDHHSLQAREDLLASDNVSPSFAISPRSPNASISITSMTRGGLSIPVSTKRKTHPIHKP